MTVTQDKEVDIFVASTIGSMKHIKYHKDGTKNSKKCIENLVDVRSLTKEDAITCMQWGDPGQTQILLGKTNKQVEVYSLLERRVTWRCDSSAWGEGSSGPGGGAVAGAGRGGGALVAALAGGAVRVWGPGTAPGAGAARPHAGPLRVLSLCPYEASYATGGDDNDVRVWDIERGAATFSAKRPAPDALQLRRPAAPAALAWAFAPLLAAASPAGYVRLYDTRAQRRPVCSLDTELAATCIMHSQELEFIVGFSRGHVQTVDLRAAGRGPGRGRWGRGYGGAAGAVTSLAAWGGGGGGGAGVAAASLDRHLRLYCRDTKRLLYQQYLTSKLRAVLVQTEAHTPLLRASEVKEEGEEAEEEEAIEVPDDLDALFDGMETIGDKPKKNKLNTLESSDAASAKKVKPSTEGSTADTSEDAILQLLRSTEKLKRKREKKKREKRAKSVFHNA